MKSRRAFLKTVAAGSAAALVTVAGRSPAAEVVKSVAAKATRRGAGAPVAAPTAAHAHGEAFDPAEVAKQKKSTADVLKTIRDFPLPAGSEMAFAFRPLKAARRKGR